MQAAEVTPGLHLDRDRDFFSRAILEGEAAIRVQAHILPALLI